MAGANKFKGLVDTCRKTYDSGVTRSYAWRTAQIKNVIKMLEEGKDEMVQALKQDLHQTEFVAELGEIILPMKEAKAALRELPSWLEAKPVSTPMAVFPARGEIRREPFGVALIIAPWNYPFSLLFKPLVGALAAGNTVVLKPSELTPNCARVCEALVSRFFGPDVVRCVTGGPEETTELLRNKFDVIMYTGSTMVGKVVMRAAAEHLTPVILELGGKSPCIIDKDVDLDVAVKRIVSGKFMNMGQTCVAPDYLLVHKDVVDAVVAKVKQTLVDFFTSNPKTSKDLSRIVNERHTQRLGNIIENARGNIVHGGDYNVAERWVAPTVILNPPADSEVMAGEIFGPILPVISVPSVDQAVSFVNRGARPLALYVFTRNLELANKVVNSTSSGGAAINDVVFHVACPELPFGGIGDSGMGAYNGRHSFNAFSHEKSVLVRSASKLTDNDARYPPLTDSKIRLFRAVFALEEHWREAIPWLLVALGLLVFLLWPSSKFNPADITKHFPSLK